MLLESGSDVLVVCPHPGEVRDFLAQRGFKGRADFLKWPPPRCPVWPRRFSGQVNRWLAHRSLSRHLRQHDERHNKQPIDLVFFACLYELSTVPESFSWKWSGLLLHCRAFRMPGTPVPYTRIVPQPQRLLSHRGLVGLATLDEGAIEFLAGLTGSKPVIAFPDVANDSPPIGGGIAERLRNFANSRPVVGCLGHLQPTKGVATFARVALDPANADIVFAFVGSLMRGVFGVDDQRLIDQLSNRTNIFIHFEALPTEAHFNAVVESCCVLFAAYHNFPHSSNILAKAAHFKKPVIVSEGYLMAERVRRFRLGTVVPEGDAAATSRAIKDLIAASDDLQKRMYEEYSSHHSHARLRVAFAQLLSATV